MGMNVQLFRDIAWACMCEHVLGRCNILYSILYAATGLANLYIYQTEMRHLVYKNYIFFLT